MKLLFSIFLIFLFKSLIFTQISDTTLLSHTFKNTIIRSYAVNPANVNELLIGIKGDKSGTGKVYLTRDAGITWMGLNNGAAVCDSCEDIQSLCFINGSTFLVGTWKNGLYITRDNGDSFQKITDFPANDIRAMRRSHDNRQLIYAATTTNGVMKSEDAGISWQQTIPDSLARAMAGWSIEIDPDDDAIIYAMTFSQGIMRSDDGGANWKQILFQKELMFWDIAFDEKGLMYAAGSNDSLSIVATSSNKGSTWQVNYSAPLAGINSINIMNSLMYHNIQIGSWDMGVFTGSLNNLDYFKTRWNKSIQNDSTGITKIYSNDNYIYVFTWGDGIKQYSRDENCFIYAPNVATSYTCTFGEPLWGITTDCETDFVNFNLFNRWGEILLTDTTSFESINYKFDVLVDADKMKAGTYIWDLRISFSESRDTLHHRGHLTYLD